MEEICFVIMPFGGRFDALYENVYAPVIRSVGLTPLRADEIYNNEPILQDIDRSIRTAKVILADVTGRNPNVNYELGAAHALQKEVILLTEKHEDVPSDYRHYRYLHYAPGDLDWNRTLADELEQTLRYVLARIDRSEPTRPHDTEAMDEPEDEPEASRILAKAKQLGYQYQYDTSHPS